MKLLREGPTSTGRSSAASSPRRRRASRLCAASFEKPRPGSTIVRSRAIPAASARASAAPSSRTISPITSRVGGRAVHRVELAPQVHEDHGRAAPGHEGRHRRVEREAAHVVHHVGAGVEGGAGHLRLRRVDRQRAGAAPAEGLDDGSRAAGSPPPPGPCAAPGRVDSPPTSTQSAPSSKRARPRATAASTSPRRPPSENESGVTLRMPTTRVRSPSTTSLPRRGRRYRRRPLVSISAPPRTSASARAAAAGRRRTDAPPRRARRGRAAAPSASAPPSP